MRRMLLRMQVDLHAKGKEASMIICVDGNIQDSIIEKINNLPDIYFCAYVKKLET